MKLNSQPQPITDAEPETVVGGAGQPNQTGQDPDQGVVGFDYGTPTNDQGSDEEHTEIAPRHGWS
ncbi:hypothetical protein [Falsiroseomonas tokyonensis]|uniref:Uncharacterized protein n=1 Tax=Falsiroseomonas tokyonensis TaxID=430521 RepID=A0ABV7BQT8_9PROT|nr:hypothetical protein [Falsiroseomonas tokyonensis]MBU8537586.1 hypothetical protein [Falsiroseomonas tokyonensis]